MKKTATFLAVFLAIFAALSLMATTATIAVAKGKALPERPVNLNTASAEELTSLPGIGKSKAQAIVTYRQMHPFLAVSELSEVKGIGPKMLERLQAYVTVDEKAVAAPQASAAPQKK